MLIPSLRNVSSGLWSILKLSFVIKLFEFLIYWMLTFYEIIVSNTFSPSEGVSFLHWLFSLQYRSFSTWWNPICPGCFYFSHFWSFFFFLNPCLDQGQCDFPSWFFFRRHVVWDLMLMSVIYIVLFLVQWQARVSAELNIYILLLHSTYQITQRSLTYENESNKALRRWDQLLQSRM